MSEFLGSRISLISKSDIRYSGVLHEIDSEKSTVSLENVKSYGTEGRRGKPEEEIMPSDQIYEYIVFRGSDVKDLRIEEGPAVKENKPPAVPNDPAIVGARAFPAGPNNGAPGPSTSQGGFNPQSPFQQPNFYPGPPGPGPWGGRGGGPGPGPDPRFVGMPYPPPGWFPPGAGFPPPGAPGPWNNFGYPGPQPQGPPGVPGQGMRPAGTPQQDNKPAPIGAAPGTSPDRQRPLDTPSQARLPTPAQTRGPSSAQGGSTSGPTPPVESKPSAEEVKATAQSLAGNGPLKAAQEQKQIPTGPKTNRVTPAVPIPSAILARAGPAPQPAPQATAAAAVVRPIVPDQTSAPVSAATISDATQQARAAVAAAMAKLDAPPAGMPTQHTNGTGSAMDNLTNKVNEMRVHAARGSHGGRGRGRGNRSGGPAKIEVPDADFDFQTSNAKFNKQELVKEAIAGSPLAELPNGTPVNAAEPSNDTNQPPAYNKTKSFFDNISSEAKDRAEGHAQKPGGREWRGEEQRKNMETFGQSSVDGGYRGYRGRGRGRGRGGRGGRGFSSGRGRGGYRSRGDAQAALQ